MRSNERKRLFFGASVVSPWPEELPKGRYVSERSRHLTLAFLGEVPYRPLEGLLSHIPTPSFQLGIGGFFDRCLFLPPRRPHVVAWHVNWLEDLDQLEQYHGDLNEWLRSHQYPIDQRGFLPHVTLARRPFDQERWRGHFHCLPMYVSAIHLYESVGGLRYQPLWSFDLLAPFEELEHTADIAFSVRGDTLEQLYLHAQLALSFKAPELLQYWAGSEVNASLEEIIERLNAVICDLDKAVGCPFKAVSYCGNAEERGDGVLEWEMIVDV